MQLYNIDLEKHFLSGLLQNPECYFDIASFFSSRDFSTDQSVVHSSLFSVIKSFIESNQELDPYLLSEKIKSTGVSFEDGISPLDYIQSLFLRKVSAKSVIETAKSLKKLTLKRDFFETGKDLAQAVSRLGDVEYDEIISTADKIYNSRIDQYENSDNLPINIYESMEGMIEERGENPIDNFGLIGPHQRLHEIYGSLLRPGNITVIVARSGIGKTQFCMDFCTKTAALNENIPILHFDNGEMSFEELTNRQCAAMSGVPLSLIETGRWRYAGETTVNKVRSVFKKISDLKFYYYNCGGLSVDEMVNTVKRFYYAKVGRGNQMIFSFDYIKTTFQPAGSKSEWQIVGEMVDRFKRLIAKDILYERQPVISMITSVQMNRLGTSRNRSSENIVEDETVVSLSDRITQFCSHMFLLRSKEPEEIAEENNFGTHKLTNIKARHLGQDPMGEIEPVRMDDGTLKRNYISLDFENFSITERGDLRDLRDRLRIDGIEPDRDGEGQLPISFME